MSLKERKVKPPKGIRKKRRRLLSEGKKEEADELYEEAIIKKDWGIRIGNHLEDKGFQGLEDLGDEGSQALDEWVTIRTRYYSGYYSKQDLDELREDFSQRYNGIFENDAVVSALRFVSNKTQRS